MLEHNYQRANTLNDMSRAYKRKRKGESKSLLTRAHTDRWRLQENKTKKQVCYVWKLHGLPETALSDRGPQ